VRREAHSESGYILLGIVIGLVVLGIFMVAAVPLWQKATQREKEAELIWRGYQYMQAIELYQKKYPGAYPPSVDVLVEQKFLRKAYTDPMSEKGDWQILRQLSPELQPGAAAQQQQAGAQSGITSLNRSQAQTRPAGGQFQSSLGRGPSDASMGGVVGVASRSTEKTFYQVPGKEKYKDWLFVWGAQPAAVTPGLPGQPQPGQPPRPGQPLQPGVPGPGVPGLGQGGLGASPFPGLPPPPSLTSIGMGRTAMPGAIPGQPAQPGQPGQSGQPGQMGNVPGTQPQAPRQQRPPD
jgi:type II secretory pathway pseudopilin PulG